MSPDKIKYAERIAKLLRQAEDPAVGQAEAEAFLGKAQALMTQYAIDEQLIAAAKADNADQAPEKIVEDVIEYSGGYHPALFDIGAAVARAQGVKVLISKRGNRTDLHLIGFESDVARAKMLDTSAQIQATGALGKWWREEKGQYDYSTASQKFNARRTFLFGFARGLDEKLKAANAVGKKEAAKAQAERADVSQDEAEKTVALVVRTREEQVQDWCDKTYGQFRKGVSRNYKQTGYGARQAGHAAGQRANLGGGQVKGGGQGRLGA